MKIPASALAIMVPLLAMATLSPQSAFAVSLPTRQCADQPMDLAMPMLSVVPELSKLETMRMQQETGLTPIQPTAYPADVTAPFAPKSCAFVGVAAVAVSPDLLPQPPQPPLAMTDRPDVFGSIALPVSHTPLDAKWRVASNARLSHLGPWSSLIRSSSQSNRTEQLQAVNQWVNARVRFTDDRRSNRSADRWSGASETLRRSRGDCEDYAIAKMKLLEVIGISRADMYLVITKDLVRRADHALLVVKVDQRFMVLDNGTDQMLDAQEVSDYRPIFSYGANGAWIHGYAEKPVRLASAF